MPDSVRIHPLCWASEILGPPAGACERHIPHKEVLVTSVPACEAIVGR